MNSQFMETALRCLERGWYVFPLGVKSKTPDGVLAPNGFNSSSNDPNQIREWWTKSPSANIGIDLGRSNLTVLDFDKGKPPAELNLPETFSVSTSRGTHIYLQGVSKQGDMYFEGEHVGEIKSSGGYVLSPYSQHPDGPVYEVAVQTSIAPIPEKLIHGLRGERKRVDASIDGATIPHGHHETTLFRIACKLRQIGLEFEDINAALVRICEKRCENYGSDYLDMCERKAAQACTYPAGTDSSLVLNNGPSAVSTQPQQPVNWQDNFKSVKELEDGEVKMLIKGFLPEGTTFIGGLPGEGKTLFALSIAKALTTKEDFLSEFEFYVPTRTPVLYLIPESGGRAFRKRCEKFGIPNDRNWFLCRTISEGATLPLDNETILEAVRRLKPVVILDTLIRFSESDDENQAMQNKQLVDDILALRHAGAVAVIGLHHATKATREKGMTLENALRGTGDIAASADAVYGLLRDSRLYANGDGPNEIEVSCLKPRDFEPPAPFRIAASARQKGGGGMPLVASTIDQFGDFLVVPREATKALSEQAVVRIVQEDPTVTLKEIVQETGSTDWAVRSTLKRLGWERKKGGAGGGASVWQYSGPAVARMRLGQDSNAVPSGKPN